MSEPEEFGRLSKVSDPDQVGSPPPRKSSVRVLLALLVVLLIALVAIWFAYAVPMNSVTQTNVDWFHYQVTSDPGIVTNTSTIHGMCSQPGESSVGVFALSWSTNSGRPVEIVRLWTLNYTTPFNLYVSWNSSSGGTNFVPSTSWCDQTWVLTVASSQTETVNAIATLTYNVTAKVPLL